MHTEHRRKTKRQYKMATHNARQNCMFMNGQKRTVKDKTKGDENRETEAATETKNKKTEETEAKTRAETGTRSERKTTT